VRRGAAAEQDQRLVTVVPQLLRGARGGQDAVARLHLSLCVADTDPSSPREKSIDLLRAPVQVLDRLAARRDHRFRKRLVASPVARLNQLAPRGAVPGLRTAQ